ncbi:Sir2 family NAD-dependent protein deacetylase [Hydrogenimonas thermophila]|uniref:SIR2 family NAD-dependent protein deacylase n=1 Tax=Hydrogenimonas thermophila TaxID=223786 RepID=UPI0029371CB7|nr:Sir2 family NAD-dependent protein deacetylase [Hydrogenimonas thermophila]WOE71069.1 Sir2 family NAD-dependent protein deacetylase [Hydrogenimonas thermophila]WOE73587.1 Sir2 family NAD-dependent protein deacetylase [Hydrogenimonas thermophila]
MQKKIIFFSGPGISAPSGIKTFRDADGLWENHKIEDVCNFNTWKKIFELVHKFYNARRVQLKDVKPNEGHFGVRRVFEKYGKENVVNITQNVDDLFEQAGFQNDEILHVHGELTKMQCFACGNVWDIGYNEFDISKDRCPKCNSLKGVKPKIVFFNESAPLYREMMKYFDHLSNPNTILVVIGTMGNVVPIAYLIGNTPAKKILCNKEPSEHLPEHLFDKIYYESIEDAMAKIEDDICSWWE